MSGDGSYAVEPGKQTTKAQRHQEIKTLCPHVLVVQIFFRMTSAHINWNLLSTYLH